MQSGHLCRNCRAPAPYCRGHGNWYCHPKGCANYRSFEIEGLAKEKIIAAFCLWLEHRGEVERDFTEAPIAKWVKNRPPPRKGRRWIDGDDRHSHHMREIRQQRISKAAETEAPVPA